MAHFLFVVPRFHPNLFFATRALQMAGHQVTLFANQIAKGEDHSHLEPQVFGKSPSYRKVLEAVTAAAPDLILLRNASALNRNASRAARRLGIPAWRYNQTAVTTIKPWTTRLEVWAKGLPQRRVTPVRGLDPTAPRDPRAAYVPWPVDRLDTGPIAPPPDGRLRVLAVGRFGAPRKNHLALMQAMAQGDLFSRISLTLVGALPASLTGEAAAYHAQVAALAAARDVPLLTNVPFDQMPALYAQSQVTVLPSTYETLGIAPVEGMAYGAVPVISTVSGAAGYVTPGENGLHVDAARPETIAAALDQLARDPGLVDRLSQGARDYVATELSAERFVERMMALL